MEEGSDSATLSVQHEPTTNTNGICTTHSAHLTCICCTNTGPHVCIHIYYIYLSVYVCAHSFNTYKFIYSCVLIDCILVRGSHQVTNVRTSANR